MFSEDFVDRVLAFTRLQVKWSPPEFIQDSCGIQMRYAGTIATMGTEEAKENPSFIRYTVSDASRYLDEGDEDEPVFLYTYIDRYTEDQSYGGCVSRGIVFSEKSLKMMDVVELDCEENASHIRLIGHMFKDPHLHEAYNKELDSWYLTFGGHEEEWVEAYIQTLPYSRDKDILKMVEEYRVSSASDTVLRAELLDPEGYRAMRGLLPPAVAEFASALEENFDISFRVVYALTDTTKRCGAHGAIHRDTALFASAGPFAFTVYFDLHDDGTHAFSTAPSSVLLYSEEPSFENLDGRTKEGAINYLLSIAKDEVSLLEKRAKNSTEGMKERIQRAADIAKKYILS